MRRGYTALRKLQNLLVALIHKGYRSRGWLYLDSPHLTLRIYRLEDPFDQLLFEERLGLEVGERLREVFRVEVLLDGILLVIRAA